MSKVYTPYEKLLTRPERADYPTQAEYFDAAMLYIDRCKHKARLDSARIDRSLEHSISTTAIHVQGTVTKQASSSIHDRAVNNPALRSYIRGLQDELFKI